MAPTYVAQLDSGIALYCSKEYQEGVKPTLFRKCECTVKYCNNREKLHRDHLIGCQGVKLFLLKGVTITSVTTATVTTVTNTTAPMSF